MWKIEMRATKKFKVCKPLVVVALLAALIVPSCKPGATHLTQNLENTWVSGQRSPQTSGESSQIPEQNIPQVLSSTPVSDPYATSTEPLANQGAQVTSPPVQTPTSALIILTPTATSRSTTPQVPTSTLAPTQAQTSTPTLIATATPTITATLTLTPALQTGWAGEWVFFVGEGAGPYRSANGIITLDGPLAEGLFTLDGSEFSFIADLSEDQLNLSGRYQWAAQDGWLAWLMDSNQVQFRGTLDNVYAFCAARVGMPIPDPCGHYVPY